MNRIPRSVARALRWYTSKPRASSLRITVDEAGPIAFTVAVIATVLLSGFVRLP